MPVFNLWKRIKQTGHIFLHYSDTSVHHLNFYFFLVLRVICYYSNYTPWQRKFNRIAKVSSKHLLHALLVGYEVIGHVAAVFDVDLDVFGFGLRIETVYDVHQSLLHVESLFASS